MEIVDLEGAREFSATHHVHKTLTETGLCAVSIACWEPGQTSPIHSHPGADEIYHILEGEGLFRDGRTERRLGPGETVLFPAGEVHQVHSLTRMGCIASRPGPTGNPHSWMRGLRPEA